MIALATRGSALARAQTELVIAALRARFPGEEFAALVVDSDGDLSPASLAPDLPGQGWFTSRLELALRRGQVEGAVHSAKELPTEIGQDLLIAGFLSREDPRDALVAADAGNLADLSPGARVGTSSPRRSAQLLALRPDLLCDPIRGNVDTRIRKVRDGEFDACVVAMAGLIRLDRAHDGLARHEGFIDQQLPCAGDGIPVRTAWWGRNRQRDDTTRIIEMDLCMLDDCVRPLGQQAERKGNDRQTQQVPPSATHRLPPTSPRWRRTVGHLARRAPDRRGLTPFRSLHHQELRRSLPAKREWSARAFLGSAVHQPPLPGSGPAATTTR